MRNFELLDVGVAGVEVCGVSLRCVTRRCDMWCMWCRWCMSCQYVVSVAKCHFARSSPAVMVIDADRNPSPTRNAPVLSAVPSLETLQRKKQKKFKARVSAELPFQDLST